MAVGCGENNVNFCPNFQLVVWKFVPGEPAIMVRLRCKSWQCDYCAKKNRELWRSHLKKRIGKIGGSWWFVTLTAHENTRTPGTSLANLRSNLDRLFKRIRRVWKRIDYVRVYETHQKGAFHAHIVMQGLSSRLARMQAPNGEIYFRPFDTIPATRSWGVQTWFKKTARELGMGYMVDVRAVETIPKVTNYITKYMTKEAQAFWVKGLRRIQTSERIGAANPRGEGGWQVGPVVYGGNIQWQAIRDSDLKITIPAEYWRDHVTYPE